LEPDYLMEEAKRLAAHGATTMRVPIEKGLRRILAGIKGKKPFKLRKASFKGNGLQHGMAGVSWQQIRDAIYSERGA
jgi:hypothetical protein